LRYVLNFWKRLTNSSSELHRKLLHISENLNLPWSAEIAQLKQKYGLEEADALDPTEYKKAVNQAIRRKEQLGRRINCANKVTCKDFLKVTEPPQENPGTPKLYITLNSGRNHSIATIHSWRAGYNDSASIQHLRKLKSDNQCTICNTEEDVEHIIKHCPKYAFERQILVDTLEIK